MIHSDFQNHMKPELLAPAGSKESFYAAINAGADAVYLAASRFGARAYAGNFTYDEIMECAETAHLYDRKIYLTVNTLVKEREFAELEEFCESGIPDVSDGLIIQDLGVASFFRNRKPDIPLHASTQMSVTGPLGAGLLKENGFTRIVPARELMLDEIRNIHDKTGMEIECFIHGAMCYSYSGQCLFSSVLGGRSGNRGRCAQPCRLPYRLAGTAAKDETYPLSLKDMCTLEILPQILDAGVCSLKVEGRMKPPEYVEGVISIYRKYLDMICSGEEYHVDISDLRRLSELYVRGSLSHGYYDRHNSRDMVTITTHGYNGSSDNEDGSKGSEHKSAYTGVTDQIPVSFSAAFRTGNRAYISVSASNAYGEMIYGYAEGDTVVEAEKSAIERDNVLKSLKKLGNTVFITDDDHIEAEIDDNAFYSLKGLNQLRRDALDDLKKNIIASYELSGERIPAKKDENSSRKDSGIYTAEESDNRSLFADNDSTPGKIIHGRFSILATSAGQIKAVRKWAENSSRDSICRIYIDEVLLTGGQGTDILNNLPDDLPVFAALSFIRRKDDDVSFIEKLLDSGKIKGLLVRNLEDLAGFSDKYADRIITDFSLYMYNRDAGAFLDRYAAGHTIPLELSSKESEDVICGTGMKERVIYGRAPLMITAGCIRKTLRSCSHKDGFETIIDRKGIPFPVRCDCHHCLNIIYNSVPLLIEEDRNEHITGRIEFSDEGPDEAEGILGVFYGINDPGNIRHTGGWYNRPVL